MILDSEFYGPNHHVSYLTVVLESKVANCWSKQVVGLYQIFPVALPATLVRKMHIQALGCDRNLLLSLTPGLQSMLSARAIHIVEMYIIAAESNLVIDL